LQPPWWKSILIMGCNRCCFGLQICEYGTRLIGKIRVIPCTDDQFRCVTMHESMHNRAADAKILRQLSKMKSEIHLLKIAGESVNIPEASTSEQSSHPRQRHRLKEPNSLDMALDSTIHSIEDFVDDSVSTVYARSTSGSEASQSRSYMPSIRPR